MRRAWKGDVAHGMITETTNALEQQLVRHFAAAFERTVSAIHAELAAGRRPLGKRNFPVCSMRENGMPSLSDGSGWDEDGPLQYSDLLNEKVEPERPFHQPKFTRGRFAEVDALVDFVEANPACGMAYTGISSADRDYPFNLSTIQIHLHLAHAANRFFLRYGAIACTPRERNALLRPFLRRLFDERLGVTNIIPIALTKFDFDRAKLAGDTYIFRMNDRLQSARWSMKANAASGHDNVVSAATHAFVIKGWTWPNLRWFELSQNLAAHSGALREKIEEVFAALRIVTGISTGFAQELRVARGWTDFTVDLSPEVYSAGARRYPEEFDNRGWLRDDLPTIDRAQIKEVGRVLRQIRDAREDRLPLALRRLNSAMIRNDDADRILDATIALEILLSDGDSQAVSYKLRARGGALANLATPGSGNPTSLAIKKIYEARSRIVHGGRKLSQNKAAQDREACALALAILRQTIRVVLDNPRFLDPQKIDSELLLG
jgi:hypothetical protein